MKIRKSLRIMGGFFLLLAAAVLFRDGGSVESVPKTEVIVGQPAVPEVSATEGVVSNDDGSVMVSGTAEFTIVPVSSSLPPPTPLSESEARKLSSPPSPK